MRGAMELLLLLCLVFTTAVTGIRISKMEVPRVVASGSRVPMTCGYIQRQDRPDPLYSVKWYRGNDQFYEYIPRNTPHKKSFPFPGITVDLDHSTEMTVILVGVTRETTGVFKCEVVGDKPVFETESKEANMTVVDVPAWGPTISGISPDMRVRPGLHIRAVCSVGDSTPRAEFTWLLNDLKDGFQVQSSTSRDQWGRVTQSVELKVELKKSHFIKGVIVLKCVARVPEAFHKTTNVTLIHENWPKPALYGWFSAGPTVQASSWLLAAALTSAHLLQLQLH